MDTSGDDHDANAGVVVNDLSLKTLIALIARLRQTETGEQFILRETELDDAYRNADSDLREATANDEPAETVEELRRIRQLVINAHDLVGESNIHSAIEELNKAVEAKLGLDQDGPGGYSLNLILFEAEEIGCPLPRTDPRAAHLVTVLHRRPGETFDAGLIDGPLGKGRLVSIGPGALEIAFTAGEMPPPLDPITLVVGLPRPQTARKVLEEATALGVAAIAFVPTEKGEPSYGRSKLWTSGEWRRHLIAGASQAFATRLPKVTWDESLESVVFALAAGSTRFALDNYEAPTGLAVASVAPPAVVAIGPERGWSARERELLRENSFELVHLGRRVLRVETACVAAVTLLRSRLGLI